MVVIIAFQEKHITEKNFEIIICVLFGGIIPLKSIILPALLQNEIYLSTYLVGILSVII